MSKPTTNNSRVRRDARGKFLPGTRPGPGNPNLRAVSAWRRALCSAISESDIRAITKALIKAARGGDVAAAKALLDRCLGKSTQTVDLHVDAGAMSEEDERIAARIAARRLGPPVQQGGDDDRGDDDSEETDAD